MKDLIERQAAVDVFQRLAYDDWNQGASTTWANAFAEGSEIIRGLPSAQPERKTGEWIPCKTPPNDGRSVFIAYGSGGLGTVCIGYYDPDDKCWREHKNWFASLLSGVKYWCEIPELPDGWKEEDDGN